MTPPYQPTRRRRQRGAAMVEFVVVAPVITIMGLGSIQYGLTFFAKNQLNHATFMAARAGSTAHADRTTMHRALARALVPMYGGGSNASELADSFWRAFREVQAFARIEILNPTKESYDDWNSSALESQYGVRSIPNGHLAEADPNDIRANSGQNLQDANLLKIRITYGYEPQVEVVRLIYTRFLAWMDRGGDAFQTSLIAQGRIPIVSHVSVLMQSDAMEDNPISSPGAGNNGNAVDPGDPPPNDKPPPKCKSMGCSDTPGPLDPGGGPNDGGADHCEPVTTL